MNQIKFAEYELLPKKPPLKKPSKELQPGKMYYIEDTNTRTKAHKSVRIGRFVGSYKPQPENIEYHKFENVRNLVNPFNNSAIPFGFSSKGKKFMEVIDFNPTELDIANKKNTISELSEFITQKRVEPYDETPTISFMGQDYRSARDRFYNKSQSRSTRSRSNSSTRKSSRKSSSSSSQKEGGKSRRRRRKTVKRRSNK
jgi:hypothetical protein